MEIENTIKYHTTSEVTELSSVRTKIIDDFNVIHLNIKNNLKVIQKKNNEQDEKQQTLKLKNTELQKTLNNIKVFYFNVIIINHLKLAIPAVIQKIGFQNNTEIEEIIKTNVNHE